MTSTPAPTPASTPAPGPSPAASGGDRHPDTDRLVWVDCEMTGLDLTKDALLEVAVLVTTPDLTVLGEGVDLVIHADDATLAGMADVVRRMHEESGLAEAARRSPVTLAEAEERVMAYVTGLVPGARVAPLCGNSIATDRNFLARDMPVFDAHLHYRMIDVSSIKELCRRWYPRVYFSQPAKGLAHRALADIQESIRELEYYRQAIFTPLPGPDVPAAKAIADQLSTAPR